MINFKKGPALSLHQVNYIGKAVAGANIVAGMIVEINSTGEVVKATAAGDETDRAKLYGFAINTQSAGDVIESGAIGVYALDGASVIETDQFVGANSDGTGDFSDYAVGTLVGVQNNTGKIIALDSDTTARVIGQVEATRNIPGVSNTATNPVNGLSVKVQGTRAVVAVKLFS